MLQWANGPKNEIGPKKLPFHHCNVFSWVSFKRPFFHTKTRVLGKRRSLKWVGLGSPTIDTMCNLAICVVVKIIFSKTEIYPHSCPHLQPYQRKPHLKNQGFREQVWEVVEAVGWTKRLGVDLNFKHILHHQRSKYYSHYNQLYFLCMHFHSNTNATANTGTKHSSGGFHHHSRTFMHNTSKVKMMGPQ